MVTRKMTRFQRLNRERSTREFRHLIDGQALARSRPLRSEELRTIPAISRKFGYTARGWMINLSRLPPHGSYTLGQRRDSMGCRWYRPGEQICYGHAVRFCISHSLAPPCTFLHKYTFLGMPIA